MTTNHRIIVTLEADNSPADTETDASGLLVEADPNPLLGAGEFRPGEDRVTWHFIGLQGHELPLVIFNEEETESEGDPRGPFETLSVSARRIVGSGDSGHRSPPLFYNIFVIDPSSRGTSLIKPRWKNPLLGLGFGGLEPPKIPP